MQPETLNLESCSIDASDELLTIELSCLYAVVSWVLE